MYAIVLMASVMFMTAVFVHIHERTAPLLGREHQPIGALIAFPIVGFLVVVMIPSAMAVAAILAIVIGWWDDTRGLNRSLGLALLLAVASIASAGVNVGETLPVAPALLVLGSWLFLWGFSLSAGYVPRDLYHITPTVTFTLAPLIAAPLLSMAPLSLATDAGLIVSGLAGALIGMRGQQVMALSLRLPLTWLVGFVILHGALHGALVFAIVSLLLWGAMVWHHARK